MNLKFLILVPLWAFLLLGLYGGFEVSWQTFNDISPCPAIGGVRVCYVIFALYAVMIAAQFLKGRVQSLLFYSAWAVVFGVALLASVLEVSNGSTCPKSSSGFALCYASLIYSGLIGVLFWFRNRLVSLR